MARRAERLDRAHTSRTASGGRAGLAVFSALMAWALPSRAQLVERFSVDQRGGFALIGNTLAHDCAVNVDPLVGNVGNCGANSADDSGADVLWSVGEASTAPLASTAVDVAEAASVAVLELPEGASVTRAELYWSAQAGAGVATRATFGRGGVSANVLADRTAVSVADDNDYYQSSADVTAFVRELGPGAFRLSGIDAADPVGLDDSAYYAGWWLVVFYALDSASVRHLGLYDGLELVDVDEPVGATLAAFEVPREGIDGQLGVVAFDGDGDLEGDALRFGPLAPLGAAAALAPANNFFDASRRDSSGAPLSVGGDLPRSSGDSGSMSGVDLHVVDVGSTLEAGQTSAEVLALTSSDRFFLAGLVVSVANTSPDLSLSSESVVDLDGPPLRPGDELEYTITVNNSGTGAAPGVTLSAALPEQVTYVPGSLAVSSGPGAGVLTDAADADTGEIDRSSGQTMVVRLGEGADSVSGGRLVAGESTVVTYRVVLDPGASGTIVSQALIGQATLGEALVTPTDSDLATVGVTPTQITVDGCALDADCDVGRCDSSEVPRRCVACLVDADCPGLAPSCDASRACVCVPSGGELSCDGKDDDCDGTIDEELVGVACSVGEGRCSAVGVTVCDAAGGVRCEASPTAGVLEVCGNGTDDDCDGTVDADDADCQGSSEVSPNDGGTELGPISVGADLGGSPLEPVGETPSGVGTILPGAAPGRGSVAPSDTSAVSLGGGGGGCGLGPQRPAGGLAPWFALGLGLLMRWRRRARGPR
jgi:clumping factor A